MIAPSAAGRLAETPLAHALVYARNRRLSGRLDLTAPDGRVASVALWGGLVTGVRTEPASMFPSAYFGPIVYELGYIDAATLDETLLEISKTKRLHGEILVARKAITPAQRDEALVEQIHRKVHHLFALPDETEYAFYDAKAPASDVAVDIVGPVWRGLREYPPARFVEETIRRIGDKALRVISGGSARLPPAETALAEALAARPMTLDEMKESAELPPAQVELLVYLLVIARCVESVSGSRTYPSTGALPAAMPSGTLEAIRPRDEIVRAIAAAMEARDFVEAGRLARELVTRKAADAEALALEAWADVRGGEATEEELRAALVRLERAVAADRTNAPAVFYRGLAHKQLGNVPVAFRDFARAMQIDPQHAGAEREVRAFAMRTRKLGSGEHALGSLDDKLGKK